MKHTVRESGQWQHTLTVEVPAEQVDARLAEVSRSFQKLVSIPGFRKGKVPLDRVRQDYAAEIEREFLERFIPEITHDALHEANLRAVVPPSVQNLKFTPGQPLTFEAVVDVAPQLEAKDWKGLSLVRRVRAVEDADIDRVIEQLREESAIFEDVDRAAASGDIVLLDSQRLDANGRRLAGTRNKGARIQLGAPALLPDLESGLTGAEAGQERTVSVTYPADYSQQDLAGQTIRYLLNIKKIQQKRLRPLDDGFARDVFQLDSLASLRDRVKRNLEGEDTQRSRRELEAQAIDELLRRHPVELSPRLVAYMLDRVLQEQTGGREVSEELRRQLEDHYRPGVERSLRRELLLSAIARQEALDVTAEEVGQQILRLAESDPRNAARVRQHYASSERRQALAESLLERKALDRVLEAAQVREEPFRETAELSAPR